MMLKINTMLMAVICGMRRESALLRVARGEISAKSHAHQRSALTIDGPQ